MQTATDEITVLLLEDDDGDAYLTKRELMRLPRVANILRAKNGQEAIGLLQSGQVSPDIAFVDLQMPTMDGLEFLSECLTTGVGAIPMVVLTSSSARNDAIRSRVRGALQVITKPDDTGELRRLLNEALESFVPSPASRAVQPAWGLKRAEESVGASSQPAPPASTVPLSSPKAFGRKTLVPRP